jgi:predicted nuclease of predicted toxin-antitoxin system
VNESAPKVKLDEHLPRSLVAALAARGIDADTVAEEGLSGATDPEVLAAAGSDGRTVLTLDRGFGDIRAYPPGAHPGIVVFRLDDQSGPAVTAAVLQLVDGHGLANLAGAITVVQGGLLRIRR